MYLMGLEKLANQSGTRILLAGYLLIELNIIIENFYKIVIINLLAPVQSFIISVF